MFPLALSPIVAGVPWSPSSVWDDGQTFSHFILHQPYFNELSVGFYFPVMTLSEAIDCALLAIYASPARMSICPNTGAVFPP